MGVDELAVYMLCSRSVAKAGRMTVAELSDYAIVLIVDGHYAFQIRDEHEIVLETEVARQTNTFSHDSD